MTDLRLTAQPCRLAPLRFCSTLSEERFHKVADAALEQLHDDLDAFVEDKLDYGDVSNEGGVLTLSLADKGTYVFNKQAPNKQIWASSPVSGPVRYDHQEGRWVYARDGHDMLQRLQQELGKLCGTQPDLHPADG